MGISIVQQDRGLQAKRDKTQNKGLHESKEENSTSLFGSRGK